MEGNIGNTGAMKGIECEQPPCDNHPSVTSDKVKGSEIKRSSSTKLISTFNDYTMHANKLTLQTCYVIFKIYLS